MRPTSKSAVTFCAAIAASAIKARKPDTKIGFVGAHAAVLPTETLKASTAIDWVGRKEFDFTCKEVAEDRDLATIDGLSFRNAEGKIVETWNYGFIYWCGFSAIMVSRAAISKEEFRAFFDAANRAWKAAKPEVVSPPPIPESRSPPDFARL